MKLLGPKYIIIMLMLTGLFVPESSKITSTVSTVTVTVSGRQAYCPGEEILIGTNFTITNTNNTGIQEFFIKITTGYQVNLDRLILTGNHPTILTEWLADVGALKLTSAVGNFMQLPVLQAAVRDVAYQSVNALITPEKSFTFSLGIASYLPSNGHYYEFVSNVGIDWNLAKAQAESRTYFGLQGYLVTITSQDEADLAGEQSLGAGWIAGTDRVQEGVWRWASGPEAGTVFWNGTSSGSTPNFAFWNSGEPNDLNGEDYAHITHPAVGIPGSWNDLPVLGGGGGGTAYYQAKGFIVEYGGMPGDPVLNIAGTTSIFVPEIETIVADEICFSGTANLLAIANEGDVYWYDEITGGNLLHVGPSFTTPELTETTTYYAGISIGTCTTIPRTPIEAVVNEYPEITRTEDDLICIGDAATISATSNEGLVSWYDSLTSDTPLFTGGLYETQPLFEDTIYYVEAIRDGCSSGERFPVNVTVDNVFPNFDLVENATICRGEGSVLIAATNPSGTYSYRWRDEDDILIGSAREMNIQSGGVYTVVAITDAGCVSDPRIVTVVESELANFTEDNIEIDDARDNNRIVINTRGLGAGNYNFAVDDPTGPFTTQTVFENLEPGVHTLYIRDSGDCGLASFQFSVLDYPSFFTPNGDGINDEWKLKGIDSDFYTFAEIKIYNRYGVLVATLNADSPGWNGVSKGWRLPSNDYWFSAKLTDISGTTIERKGHFSLLRR